MKKRALTLIEVMIALGIASLLFAVMFPYLAETTRIKQVMESEKNFIFAKAHVQARLSTLFSQMPSNAEFKTTREKNEPPKLQFEFYNEYAQDSRLLGNVQGILFLNPNGNLMLSIEKEGAKYEEVLIDGCSQINFQFAYAEQGLFTEKRDEWNQVELPLFFVMKVAFFSDKTDSFYFRLQSSSRLQYPT